MITYSKNLLIGIALACSMGAYASQPRSHAHPMIQQEVARILGYAQTVAAEHPIKPFINAIKQGILQNLPAQQELDSITLQRTITNCVLGDVQALLHGCWKNIAHKPISRLQEAPTRT